MTTQRVLVVSHAHPAESKGGGEIAAHQLHREFTRQGQESLLVAAARRTGEGASLPYGTLAAPAMESGAGSELLWHTAGDSFHLGVVDGASLTALRRVIERFRPTVVNFHHYLVGVEAMRVVKQFDERIPIVLTLHEYLAVCHRDGQMLKPDGRLCFRSGASDCAQCFPQHSAAAFHARKRYIQSFLQLADAYVSPSQFLIDRYVAWGLPESKFRLIENGQPPLVQPTPSLIRPPSGRDSEAEPPRKRFAFFGSVTPYKGVDLLLEAVGLMSRDERKDVTVEIHGGGVASQSEAFRHRVERFHAKVRRHVTFRGEYDPSQVGALMSRCDWVVVPSLWWENSPMVIQEAFRNQRPVICTGIGGMAEKVQHMKTGLWFQPHSARDLADTMLFAARSRGLWQELTANIEPPVALREAARAYLTLFERLSEGKDGRRRSMISIA